MKKFLNLLVGIAILSITSTAMAVPITGEITFGATLPSGTNLATLTTINIQSPSFVTSSTGDLAGILPPGSQVTFSPISLAPFSPVKPLWTSPSASFDLLTAQIITQLPQTFSLQGTGVMHLNGGFEDTAYAYSVSADKNQSGLVVAISATNSPLLTPEPSSLTLLLSGFSLLLGSKTVKKYRRV